MPLPSNAVVSHEWENGKKLSPLATREPKKGSDGKSLLPIHSRSMATYFALQNWKVQNCFSNRSEISNMFVIYKVFLVNYNVKPVQDHLFCAINIFSESFIQSHENSRRVLPGIQLLINEKLSLLLLGANFIIIELFSRPFLVAMFQDFQVNR